MILLLILIFINSLIFSSLVPMWHGPDEQAHFAQVQYLAEHLSWYSSYDQDHFTSSQEVVASEELLGTHRDETGRNKFTFNPNFRIEYTNSSIGKYELLIQNFPLTYRTNLVKKEATVYPPLFYIISAIPYRAGYNLGLIDRVFLTRLASIIMGLGVVYYSFKLSQLVFPRQPLLSLTSTLLVSFQPMFSFLTISVTSDNLMNFIFTAILYFCTKVISRQQIDLTTTLGILFTFIAGFFTKPHFIIAIPVLVSLPLFLFSFQKWGQIISRHRSQIIWVSISLAVVAIVRISPQVNFILTKYGVNLLDTNLQSLTHPRFPNYTLLEHINWTLRHTVAEVIPWYWGVFNWLGVTLPRSVNRVINRILILSAFGLVIWLIKLIKYRRWQTQDKLIVFLGLSSLIYFSSLMLWDWLFRRQHGFSFGMQGRYYFPTIVGHMILILTGWINLIPKSWWVKLLGMSTIALNFIGLYTLAKSYYQLWPLAAFFNQFSQYKPVYFKFPYILIWFTLYTVTLTIFVIKYLAYADHSRNRPQSRS